MDDEDRKKQNKRFIRYFSFVRPAYVLDELRNFSTLSTTRSNTNKALRAHEQGDAYGWYKNSIDQNDDRSLDY